MMELPVLDCNRCELRASCSQVVWGDGPGRADIVIIGESPGSEEDLMGTPFMSRESHLLRKIMIRAGLDPASCHMTYAVKCSSAAPTAAQANECRVWLWQELVKTSPKVVVSLGRLPTQMLLGLKKSFKLGDVAGAAHAVPFMKAVVVPWYSASYVLSHGKNADAAAAAMFRKVKEIADAVA